MQVRPKEKPVLHYGQSDPLPVMEQFYTLQGEGAWAGTAAYFIRLAGCDVGCHWCDVKESWHPHPKQYQSSAEICEKAVAAGAKRVVITGGEPTVYDLSVLCKALHEAGLYIHMETAGPHPYTGEIDWICFSPKKFLPPKAEYYQLAHELKVIVYNKHDFKWAEEHASRCANQVQLFLQAEWSRKDRFNQELVEYVKKHPHWRLSIQTHKYLDIP